MSDIWQYVCMSVKSTFTLDEETTLTLRRLAQHSGKPQSLIVREAIAHYAARDEKTTPDEREQWLSTFDNLVARVSPRPRHEIDAETAAVKASRAGWTRRPRR